jgi:hypothetical protein
VVWRRGALEEEEARVFVREVHNLGEINPRVQIQDA